MDWPIHWNEAKYLLQNSDVAKAIKLGVVKSGWHHYLKNGQKEKRDPAFYQFETFLKDGTFKVNYVVAAWSGKRREGNDEYHQDRSIYLRKHLKSLKVFKHLLSQITVVIPYNDKEPKEFSKFIKTIPKKIAGVEVVVLRRENVGQSYGSYAHVYEKYKKKFTHYILIEDDYIFFKDYFDVDLVYRFETTKNCGLLCSLTSKHGNEIHAAISNGITSSENFQKIWEKFDEIPHGKKYTQVNEYSAAPQVIFSQNFLDIGTRLCDLIESYRAPFNDVGELVFYGNTRKDLIIPLQFLEVFDQEDLLHDK